LNVVILNPFGAALRLTLLATPLMFSVGTSDHSTKFFY
jgi:hypothetical protein